MNELVFKNNNEVVTSSRNVARDFNKTHKDVLESIDRIIKGVAENTASLFYETTYIHDQNKQKYRQFLMNRDGFTLLVMGFTGRKAMKFKLKYIEAFNKMEKTLHEVTKPSYMIDDPIKRAEIWIVEQKEKQKIETEKKMLEQQVAEYEPKITYVDEILKSTDLILTTQIAEDYGMTAQAFNKLLHQHGIQHKMNGQWLLYGKYKGLGYTKSDTSKYKRKDGSEGVSLLTKWTQKGRLFLYEFLKANDILPTMEQMKLTLIENKEEII